MALQWYVVRAKPQSEYAAYTGLIRSGFETRSFHILSWRFNAISYKEPLFPGYLFVRCDVKGKGWSSFGHLNNILSLVHFDGEYPVVPDEIINDLSRRVDQVNIPYSLSPCYRKGQKVCVRVGSGESLGEVVSEPKPSSMRLRILMEFLGRRVYAEVSSEKVRPLKEGNFPNSDFTHLTSRRTRGGGRWIKGFGPRVEREVVLAR
jgi:transcriptional antiterminator RfaH